MQIAHDAMRFGPDELCRAGFQGLGPHEFQKFDFHTSIGIALLPLRASSGRVKPTRCLSHSAWAMFSQSVRAGEMLLRSGWVERPAFLPFLWVEGKLVFTALPCDIRLPNHSATQIVLVKFMASLPDFSLEQDLLAKGFRTICGVDEVGRGPMAGPVTAAAVILDPHNIPTGLNDSKKLTLAQREQAFEAIMLSSRVSVASLSAKTIDRMNIRAASLHAMAQCISALDSAPDHALVDGNAIPHNLTCSATCVVKGDGQSLSIAAASIVAKVMRDRMMERAHSHYPAYGLAGHKGYPTVQHKEKLLVNGVSRLHRRSFKPVHQALEKS